MLQTKILWFLMTRYRKSKKVADIFACVGLLRKYLNLDLFPISFITMRNGLEFLHLIHLNVTPSDISWYDQTLT